MNYKNLPAQEVKKIIDQYIMGCIPDSERIKNEWDKIANTDKERINFVLACYESEYNYSQNKRLYPNDQDRLAQWLMGLPSAISIDFENYRILELTRGWGLLQERNGTKLVERNEDKIISRWFGSMAFKIMRLHEKLNKG